MDVHFKARGARHGEIILFTTCGPRGIQIRREVRVDGMLYSTGSTDFGEHDNARCVLRDVERVEIGAASPPTGTAQASGAPVATTDVATSSVAESQAQTLHEIPASGDQCAMTSTSEVWLGKLTAGVDIHVRVWANEPQDLEDAILRIEHDYLWPNVSEKKWQEHLAAEERKREEREARERAARAKDKPMTEAEMRAQIAKAEAKASRGPRMPSGPPPAARVEVAPPRPSVNADWVAGYWHWSKDTWVWIAGSWRVPPADVSAGLTATAPHAPPAPRAEDVPPRPTPEAEWVSGYWAWDGKAYVWVAGSWQLPPGATDVWRAASWRVTSKGVVFVPGGWRRR